MCIAVGNVSFDDCPLLTWSFGWTGFFEPQLAARQLDGAVRDDLVGVHVRLRAGAGLPERPAGSRRRAAPAITSSAARHDQVGLLRGSRPSSPFASAAAFLRMPRARMIGRATEAVDADREMLERPLRLGAPVEVCRHLDGAHRIGLGANSWSWPGGYAYAPACEPASGRPGVRSFTSLRGHLLVAAPDLLDPNFRRSVVLLTEHDAEAAMGVVWNCRLEVAVADAVPALAESSRRVRSSTRAARCRPARCWRWPTSTSRRCRPGSRSGSVGYLRGDEDPTALVGDVGAVRVFSGYSGWGPGQLEAELEQDAWITLPAQSDDVFGEPDGLGSCVPGAQGRPLPDRR